ncbi:MAG: hypothetical protein LBG27_04095, partial [Spirochaetaceae bacterium]|nr:hypothetical protein [Spirochaetaceae bacterium]
FLYLSLVMDLWSRKTVGCHAGDTLEAEGALRALKMALENFPRNVPPLPNQSPPPIHPLQGN